MWPFTKQRTKTQATPLRAKFDLAQTTANNRKHWASADALSARAALSPAVRRVVRMRSRFEADNNSWYSGILRTAVNHIVGIGPRLQLTTGNPEANQRVETAWRNWIRETDFVDTLRTMCEAYWRDGEVFLMRAELPKRWPMTLDAVLIEAEQVTNPQFGKEVDSPYIDDGIALDPATNERLIYVLDWHPGSSLPIDTSKGQWYQSSEVLHLFRAERPGQVRGIPRATSALQTLPIMRRQELATLHAAETAASFAMFMKSTSPTLDPSESPADFAEIEIAANMLTTLPVGWEVEQMDPKQPGPQYEMFQRQALMSFCRCTNMPYTLAAGTGKDANFSSFRGDMINVWEPEVHTEQSRLETCVMNKVLRWFLESAVYIPGLLDGLPSINLIDYRWHWPPLPELDARDAVESASTRLRSGLSSPTDEFARKGLDWQTESAKAASDYGLSIEAYRKAVFSVTFPGAEYGSAATPQAVGTDQAVSAPTAVADTAMNGAQVTSIVEIITQVAAGAIPYQTANALIRSAFPAIPQANIDQMLAPFAAVPQAIPGAVPGTPTTAGGEYTELGQRAFNNNLSRIRKTLAQLVDPEGGMSRVMAEQTLLSIGLTQERVTALIEDAIAGTMPQEQTA